MISLIPHYKANIFHYLDSYLWQRPTPKKPDQQVRQAVRESRGATTQPL